MVKICPKCGVKNFDDTKYCEYCNKNIKGVVVQPDVPIPDDFPGFKPRGMEKQFNYSRYFNIMALIFAALYLLCFFLFPLILVLFLLAGIIVYLGGFGFLRGDKFFGGLIILLGIILIIITIYPLLNTMV